MTRTLPAFLNTTCHIIMSVLALVFSLIAHGYSLSNVTEDSASAEVKTGPISSVITTAKILAKNRDHPHAEMLMVKDSGKIYRSLILRQHLVRLYVSYLNIDLPNRKL